MDRRRGPARTVAALGTLAALAALAVVVSLDAVGSDQKKTVTNLANVLASGALLVCALRAAHHATRQRRTGWICLSAAAGAWFTGNLLWSWYQLFAERQPFPSLADACYLAALPCAMAAVLSLQVPPRAGAGRVRVVLDGFLTSTALLFVAWHLLLAPLWRSADGNTLNQLVVTAYPAADVVLATLALGMLVRSRLPWQSSSLLVLGLFLYFVGDAHLALSTLQQDFGMGTTLDLGWTAGYAALAWAAVLGGSRPPGRSTPRRRVLEVSTPYLAVLSAAVVAGVARIGPDDLVLAALGGTTLLLVALHQGLVLSENVALTAGLEAAVASRTAELEASRKELTRLAFHDPLTGLGNRLLLRSRLRDAIARLARRPGCCAVLLLDVDDFKTTNDTLGHGYGDALLVSLADRLREVVRAEDTLSRLGGDEFAIVLDHLASPAAATALADRILAATHHPLDVDGHAILASVSIGIALGDLDDDADDLLRQADVAMYQSKAFGKGTHTTFVAAMHAEVVDRLSLRADIRRGLAADEFTPYFQPIVDMQTEQVIGVEALARWAHPKRGLVSPAVFIPLAEESGLINDIGRLVLRRACTTVQRWRTVLGRPLTVNVNVSARQLRDPAFVGIVQEILAETGIPAGAVTLEVTESMLLSDADGAVAALHALRSLGLHLALDDFGTGYSSLSQLRQLPVDHIKIDKSFVDGLVAPDARDDAWSRAVIELARQLGLVVTAEGIEQQAQAQALRELRCDRGQGFLFARPLPEQELLPLLISLAVPAPR